MAVTQNATEPFGALQGLRAPIYEEKVVDYVLEFAEVADKAMSQEELVALGEDDEDAHGHAHHDHDH